MRRNSYKYLLVFAYMLSPETAYAALGGEYDSYYDLHTKTAYGAVFFNKDAIRYQENRSHKRFVEITANGEINLPQQRGYCFVFNHYRPELVRKEIKYSINITKRYSDNTTKTETLMRTFSITGDTVSGSLPDICVSGIQNVVHITIATTSNHGSDFDWNFAFQLD